MKILITGVCGFVGSSLAKTWLEQEAGLTVYGLDNFIRPGSEVNRGILQDLGVRLFHGDIRQASDLEVLPSVDWVIDAAANPSVLAGVDGKTSSRQLVEHNLLGSLNLLEYCKHHDAGFMLISTSRVYSTAQLSRINVEVVGNAFQPARHTQELPGFSPSGVSEGFSTAAPISLYGGSKLATEVMALEYGESYGLPVWINRCGVLAGAGQFGRIDQGIFTYWINSWNRQRPLKYLGFGGSGHQVRDCLHPRDLVSLLRKQAAAGPDVPDRVFNLGGGCGNAMSLAELSDWCRERFGKNDVSSDPEQRRYDVPWLVMDSSCARKTWGWMPETPILEILEEIACHAELHENWLELSSQS